jgi:signal transduction histidine kinase
VPADRDRLTQALDNLLGNALRHGVPPVRVVGRRRPGDDSTVAIRVSDHGSGVAAEMQPRLFSRFATGRSRGGTGLGLYIVRELSRAHGGDAFYDPPSPERPEEPAGAFVVSMPRAEPGV